MKTIDVDDEIYALLERSVQGFNETPNAVLRRLLSVKGAVASSKTEPQSKLQDYMASTAFSFWGGNAKRRYLGLLSFLHGIDPQRFAEFEGYQRGSRIHISRDRKRIEGSGESTQPEQIPNTDYFAITNLPNSLKRVIVSDFLKRFGFSAADIEAASRALSDRG